MSFTIKILISIIFVSVLLGCNSMPKYKDAKHNFPEIQDGYGRVFIYVGGGSLLRPAEQNSPVYIDDVIVGPKEGNVVYYVDLKEGTYSSFIPSLSEYWQKRVYVPVKEGKTTYYSVLSEWNMMWKMRDKYQLSKLEESEALALIKNKPFMKNAGDQILKAREENIKKTKENFESLH